jgi:hypothetical protein
MLGLSLQTNTQNTRPLTKFRENKIERPKEKISREKYQASYFNLVSCLQ